MQHGDWQQQRDRAGIVWLGLDCADRRLNVLSLDVLQQLAAILAELATAPPAGLVLYSAKTSGFCAGADLREFDLQTDEQEVRRVIEQTHALFNRIENLPCPTVAAIDGICLGGGLELALACDWRILVDRPATRLGFPEIQLGLFPGFGGTARSVRLLGGRRALTLMLTGKQLPAATAVKLGLANELCSPHRSWQWCARQEIEQGKKSHRPPLIERLTNHWPARPLLAQIIRRQAAKKATPRHFPAPTALIDLWAAQGHSFPNMLAGEATQVPPLLLGATSQNLRRVFRLMERLKDLGNPTLDPTLDWQPRRVHVVGAGTMGGDIAAWCALRGRQVSLQDRESALIEQALRRAAQFFARKVRNVTEREAVKLRLLADPAGAGLAAADLIIEAIPENLAAKQALFAELETKVRPTALLATNTSALPLAEIAARMQQPQRLIGLHFFNPATRMPLVEVVRGTDSDPAAVTKGMRFCGCVGRLPLPVKSTPGFLVNRVLAPYMAGALQALQAGHPREAIDAALRDFGMPMGPLELADTVGLDVGLAVVRSLLPDHRAALEFLQAQVATGRLGKKTGAGIYRWKNGKPIKPLRGRWTRPDQTLAQQLIQPLLAECQACLDAGIVADADLLDAGVIFGTGFAPHRGGPLHYLRSLEPSDGQPDHA